MTSGRFANRINRMSLVLFILLAKRPEVILSKVFLSCGKIDTWSIYGCGLELRPLPSIPHNAHLRYNPYRKAAGETSP